MTCSCYIDFLACFLTLNLFTYKPSTTEENPIQKLYQKLAVSPMFSMLTSLFTCIVEHNRDQGVYVLHVSKDHSVSEI